NHKNTGRPAGPDKYTSKYTDLPSSPLFPFGYGLSYTSFEYKDLKLSVPSMTPGGTLNLSFTLTNTGTAEGAEVLRLYVHAGLLASVAPAEIECVPDILCGVVGQTKLGMGHAGVRDVLPESAAESATLELVGVDRAFEQIARLDGKGSADARLRLLRDLLLSA